MSENNLIKSNLENLRKEIIRHDLLYYRNSEPEISDFEYDKLKKQLIDLETKYPELEITDSPAQNVGDDRIDGFDTYKHLQLMLSLDNTYNRQELNEFENRLRRLSDDEKFKYIIEPKIDGVAISLTYEKGKLIRAVTRGNGVEGDDITENLFVIKNLKHEITGDNVPDIIEIRGEIYMLLSEFDRLNIDRDLLELPRFANPRNLASGTIKMLDRKELSKRKLEVVLHGLGFCEPPIFKNLSDFHSAIREWELPYIERYWNADGIENAWNCIQDLDGMRNSFKYATDGAVIKLDSISSQLELGATSKAPRWAIAYKFAAEQAETRINEITIQVGRTGALTPVAELKPVFLSGTTVSRATLHNADEIERKDVRVGDIVIIEKAGEIIPAVISVIKDKRDDTVIPFVFPKECPACNTEVVRLPDEAAWRCPNLSCSPQVRRRIIHFASRVAMDIEGLGIAVIEQLVEKELIESIADIYELTVENVLPLEKFALKSSENLIASIAASKKNELWRLIHGLGIQHVGAQASKDLASHFGSLQTIREANEEKLIEVEGIGETMAKSITNFFTNDNNNLIVQRLIDFGLNIIAAKKVIDDTLILSNKSFVLTGTLPNLKREEAKKLIEQSGGKVVSSISSKTDFLLAGESPGSKYSKAQKLNIAILDEKTLLEILNNN